MSLRIRLLLAVGAVALAALGAADVAVYSKLHSFLYGRVDSSLETTHFPVETAVNEAGSHEQRLAVVAPGTFVEVRDDRGAAVYVFAAHLHGGQEVTPSLPPTVSGLTSSEPGEPHAYLTVRQASPGGTQFRVRVSTLGQTRLTPNGGYLFLGVPLDETIATLHQLLAVELTVTAVALGAAILLGWWLVRVGLRPLADVERTAVAIAAGELDRRVPGDEANTEVGQVARALNTMLSRIQDAFAARDATEARLRRFVGDASHELRTPLAAVSAYAQLFERGAKNRPADLARVMAGIRAETVRMGRLVEDLLLLARLDEGRPLERTPMDLVALAGEAMETATAVGPDWTVRLEADRPVEIEGDPTRLRQVLDNLLANVRAHTPPGTPAVVRVSTGGGAALIEVADHGPGLSADAASRVFERFYRADPSRSRQHGGSGLGLGIVAAIVSAHGGDVAASETPGGGATFTVRIPLANAGNGAGRAVPADVDPAAPAPSAGN